MHTDTMPVMDISAQSSRCTSECNLSEWRVTDGRGVEASVRSNIVIALGDLAVRFPNVLEPWTPHMYRPLTDADPGAGPSCKNVTGAYAKLHSLLKVQH